MPGAVTSLGDNRNGVDMRRAVFATLILAAFISESSAQQATVSERYVMQDVMIPTRDGTKLHTRVLAPRAQSGPLPFMMERTPYGIGSALQRLNGQFRELAEDNYIFVFRSEEHTSELQSQSNLVCRLLLEKKKKTKHKQ